MKRVSIFSNICLIIVFFSLIPPLQAQWQNVGSAGFSPGEVRYPRLIIQNNTPYVAFQDLSNSSKATVMKFNGTSWVYVGVPGFTTDAVNDVGLALKDTVPYVAFRDYFYSQYLSVYKLGQSGWEVVGTNGFSNCVSDWINITFRDTTPYVCYRNVDVYGMSVVKYNGTSWQYVGSQYVSPGNATNCNIVMMDTTPYIAYKDVTNGSKAVVKKFNGSSWVSVGINGFTSSSINGLCLAISDTTPYVSFTDFSSNSRPGVMKFDGNAWVSVGPAVFGPTNAGFVTSLAIIDTTPYIAFSDYTNGRKACVMKFDGSNWVYVGSSGFSTDMAESIELAMLNSTPYVLFRDLGQVWDATLMNYCNQDTTVISPDACITFSLNNQTYTGSGTYYQSFTNQAGCDSTLKIQLTVNTVDTSVTISTDSLISNAAGASYQWLDCSNLFAPVAGAASQAFHPSLSGSYAVQVTEGICTDTSSCHIISLTGLGEVNSATIAITPNPGHGLYTIFWPLELNGSGLEIFDIQGREVYKGQLGSSGTLEVDFSGNPPGIYIVIIQNGTDQYKKYIIQQ